MKPYYDPDSRPQAHASTEIPDEPPIPDNELPDDALANNEKVRESSGDQPLPIDASADSTT